MSSRPPSLDPPLLCHRCGKILAPGSTHDGAFFVVRIEAFADPTPPTISGIESLDDLEREIDQLMDDLDEKSERELMDEIHRRLTITLCGSCYRPWIENPAG
jgi:RNase P subunit RPR2